MSPQAPWPDINKILTLALADKANKVVGPRLYANFEIDLPVIRVRRIGGNSDRETDYPRTVVDVYADTYEVAAELAEDLRQEFLVNGSERFRTVHGRIDRCEVEVAPIEIPYSSPDVHHITATYRLSTRR